jgi:hypothetical protein
MKFLKKAGAAVQLLAAFALASCENIVEVPMPEHKPKLAIRYMLGNDTPDSAFYVNFPSYQPFVSHSQGILDNEELKGLNDADLTVSDSDGKVVETFKIGTSGGGTIGNGYYQAVSRFVAAPGQTYTFTASAPNFETVTGTLTLPNKVNGLQASYTKTADHPLGEVGKVTITLPDKGDEKNYYSLFGALLDNRLVANNRDVFYEERENEDEGIVTTEFDEIHFSNRSNTTESYTTEVFSDENLNGRSVTITRNVFLLIGDPAKRPKYLRIIVHSVTHDTYRFLKSSQSYVDNYGNPFAEPTRVIGNINNGYGYFGGYTSTYFDIPL